jgi:hypothetical protein
MVTSSSIINMDKREPELPFANDLAPIAGEIIARIDEYNLEHEVLPQVEDVTEHVMGLRSRYGSSMSRRRTADAVVRGIEIFPSWTIAYMLLQRNNPFQRWADRDKRYLLDRALGAEIISVLYWGERDGAKQRYYPRTGGGRQRDEEYIASIRSLQGRLSKRATPTPPHMRS